MPGLGGPSLTDEQEFVVPELLVGNSVLKNATLLHVRLPPLRTPRTKDIQTPQSLEASFLGAFASILGHFGLEPYETDEP